MHVFHDRVQVLDNSPALKAGMEAYFDFIISVDGVRLVRDSDMLPSWCKITINYTVPIYASFNNNKKLGHNKKTVKEYNFRSVSEEEANTCMEATR